MAWLGKRVINVSKTIAHLTSLSDCAGIEIEGFTSVLKASGVVMRTFSVKIQTAKLEITPVIMPMIRPSIRPLFLPFDVARSIRRITES